MRRTALQPSVFRSLFTPNSPPDYPYFQRFTPRGESIVDTVTRQQEIINRANIAVATIENPTFRRHMSGDWSNDS